jgi:hypothetical protein
MSLQNSFSEIRSRSSPEENMYVIENITILQRDIRNSNVAKRDINSLQSESEDPLGNAQDENFSPARKKNSLKKMLFDETASYSSDSLYDLSHSQLSTVSRPPLFPIDMNTMTNASSSLTSRMDNTTASNTRLKYQDRTLRMKARKAEQQNKQQKG